MNKKIKTVALAGLSALALASCSSTNKVTKDSDNVHLYDSHNCVVHTLNEKKVVVQGLDGYIVAENDNSLLVHFLLHR